MMENATERDSPVEGASNESRQSPEEGIKQANTIITNPVAYLTEKEPGCDYFWIGMVFALSNCLTIAMIVIGAMYEEEKYCPVEKISLLLIVGGSITLVNSLTESISKFIVTLKPRDQPEGSDAPSPPGWLKGITLLLGLASTCWFIAACVKVYSVSSDSLFPNSENYCHPVLYYFAYWYLTGSLAIAILCNGNGNIGLSIVYLLYQTRDTGALIGAGFATGQLHFRIWNL